MKTIHELSLRWRYLLGCWLLIAMVTGVFAVLLYDTQKREYLAGIDAHLATAVQAVRHLAGLDYHDRIADAGSIPPDEYLALVDANNRLCQETGLQYLWSNLFLPDGRIVFTSATSPGLDSRRGNHAAFFSTHSDPAAFDRVRKTGTPAYSSFTNEWGRGRMLLAPFADRHGRTYVFGASIATDQLEQRLSATRWKAAGVFLLMLVPGAAASLWLSALIIQPLRRLREAVEIIARGNYGVEIAIRGGGEEIEALNANIRAMARAIQAGEDSMRAALAALDRERGFLKTLIQTLPDLIWLKSPEGVYLACNPQFERFFGAREAEIIGKTDYDFVDKELADFFRDHDRKAMTQGVPTVNEEWITYADDGRRVLLETTKTPMFDNQGQLVGVLGIGHDITEARAMQEDARRANRMKGEFLANMSHEIRTPMNAVIGLSRLLRETPLSAEQRNLLDKVVGSSRMLLEIINDILDFSKIEAGRLELDRHDFDLDGLLDQMQALFAAAAAAKGLALAFHVAPNVPRVLVGDSLRLGQVLANLLSNALKFTGQGQVELRIARVDNVADGERTLDAEERTAQPGGPVRLRFAVRDTGIGMDERQVGKLFQAFVQADASTTRKYGGAGLGLAISRGLVERMGGVLGVESSPGQGSLFFFELNLPVVATMPGAASRAPVVWGEAEPAAVPSLAGSTILLVEDNALNQEVALRWLEKTGARVIVAADGAEAVDRVQSQSCDLVLMDLQMPVMDGFEATCRIRRRFPDLPVIALSAAVMEADREQARAAGMNAHLAKPLDERALYRTLTDWLKPGGAAATAATATAIQTGTPALNPPPALEGFDLEQGLRAADRDAAFYQDLLHRFRNQLSGEFATADAVLARGDAAAARRMAHTLKGIAGTVGAVRLARIAAAIDGAFKNGLAITEAMHLEFSRALQAARDQLATLPPRPNRLLQVDREQGAAAVADLLRALRANEAADDGVLALATSFLATRLDCGKAAELENLVNAYKNDASAALLLELAAQAGVELR